MEDAHKLSVFVSYASEDRLHAINVASVLRAAGFNPWFDKDKLLPGVDWKAAIEKAVEKADAIVICVSRDSITKKGYLQEEIAKALAVAKEQPPGSVYLIPARLEPCDLPDEMEGVQWVDLFEPEGMPRLVEGLRAKAEAIKVEVVPEPSDDPLVGQYLATGNNSNGTMYEGQVIISPHDDDYLVTWYVAGERFVAHGMKRSMLTVEGDFNFTYLIDGAGQLEGEWDEGAIERLGKLRLDD